MSKIRNIRGLLEDRIFPFKVQMNCEKKYLGTEYGGWTICPSVMKRESNILSIGVGNDISFDLELIKNFDSNIFAFDPTPKSIQWIVEHRVPEKFRFFPYGLYSRDDKVPLYLPKDERNISCSTTPINTKFVLVDMKRIESILELVKIKKFDILKMDIEGSEYQVIPEIVEAIKKGKLEISQLLIEFHHRFKGQTRKDTQKCIDLLNNVGFKIFSIRNNQEFSLIYNN